MRPAELASSASGSRLDVKLPVGVAAAFPSALPDPGSVHVVVAIRTLQAEICVPRYYLAVSHDGHEGGIDPPRRCSAPERESLRTPVFREPDVELGTGFDQHCRRVSRGAVGTNGHPAVRDQTSVLEDPVALFQGRIGRMWRERLRLPLNAYNEHPDRPYHRHKHEKHAPRHRQRFACYPFHPSPLRNVGP